jgi:hypothetical protein
VRPECRGYFVHSSDCELRLRLWHSSIGPSMRSKLLALSCLYLQVLLKSCHAEMIHGIIGTRVRGWFPVNHKARLNVGFARSSYLTEEIKCWPTLVIYLL